VTWERYSHLINTRTAYRWPSPASPAGQRARSNVKTARPRLSSSAQTVKSPVVKSLAGGRRRRRDALRELHQRLVAARRTDQAEPDRHAVDLG
jgi:hypothetical protein